MADLEALKQALPIEEVVGEYVQLRKAGAAYKGLCPFHGEKTPSFTVNPERGSFKCFGCGKGGDAFTFLMEIEKIDFKEAVRRLARKAGMEVDLDKPQPVDPEAEEVGALNEAASLYFQAALASPAGAAARAYLERRGITAATVERFGLGWAPAGWDNLLRHLRARGNDPEALTRAGLVVRNQESGRVYDRFRDRLIFPIRDAKGRLTGFGGRELDGATPKYLNSPQTKLFDKGSVLYLLEKAQEGARAARRIVVVEGYMDALMAHQGGFPDVVASLGTALTDRQLRLLYRAAPKVVMALDADPAGQRAMLQTTHLAYQVFERQRVAQHSGRVASERAPGRYRQAVDMTLHVAALPDGQDPDEVIRADPARWNALIDAALPIVEFCFAAVANAPGGAAERRQRANTELLPIIAEVADPLERGHYVDRLATLLEMPESVIASAVEQQRRQPRPAPAFAPRAAPPTPDDDGPPVEAYAGDAADAEEEAPRPARSGGAAFLLDGLRNRQQYLLSMLLRYPRVIADYAPLLTDLRPSDERLGAAWDAVLACPDARTFDDLTADLPEDGPLTVPYLEAILNFTASLPAFNDAELRRALDHAAALLRSEHLRQEIAHAQSRLRAADGDERAALLTRLAALVRDKAALG